MGVTGPGPRSRSDALQRFSEGSFDLLVIGGGITGAGVALDAATRGLSVALVEARDFASGTSSRSSKLIHGGLRYLEHRDFALMREAAIERDRLRRIAPHLVTPIPFLFPVWAGGSRKAGLGLSIYDLLAGFGNFERHRRVDGEEAARLVPGTSKAGGGYVYYDSQTDDVRLTMAILMKARDAGAVVCNHLRVTDLLAVSGSISGVVVEDRLDGRSIEIRANDVVNATGVWADELRLMERPGTEPYLRPSKGVHLVLQGRSLPLKAACLLPAGKRRTVFAVPWRSSVIVGTTDTGYEGPLEEPGVTAEEAAYLLGALSRNFDRPFGADDVAGAYAGLRPLLAHGDTEETRDLSRRHAVFRGDAGLVTVTGGKLTTYRVMAEEVVDLVTRRRGDFVPGVTASIRLGIRDPQRLMRELQGIVRVMGLAPEVAVSLISSYGDHALDVLELGRRTGTAEPVTPGLPYLRAEILWAAREEMAQTVDDVMARRMRLDLEDPGGGVTEEDTTALLKEELSRTGPAEVEEYLAGLARERGPALLG